LRPRASARYYPLEVNPRSETAMADTTEPKRDIVRNASSSGDDPFILDEATDEVLRLHLDAFEGPFEVLLYLIRVQEIDIFDIPISKITDQYIRFLEMMREENLDVAGEFIVMAATLIQIKSKMILPAELDSEEEDIEEEDPRLELVEKLLEYRRYRDIMLRLQVLEEARLNVFARNVKPEIEEAREEEEFFEVSIYDLIQAFRGVLRYVVEGLPHTVLGEGASIDEKIACIEDQLAREQSISWMDLFRECKSRVEIVCCFLAILELCRMGRIRAHQHQNFGDIRLFPVTAEVAGA
jgi:segregation and condensation protein A